MDAAKRLLAHVGTSIKGSRSLQALCGCAAVAGVYMLCKGLTKSGFVPTEERLELRVVITGCTRGFGKELAKKFLALGDSVVICGRDAMAVHKTVEELRSFTAERCKIGTGGKAPSVFGFQADVSSPDSVQQLALKAYQSLGGIDIWVNNAGMSVSARLPLYQLRAEEVHAVVSTNLIGALLCCREATRYMIQQPLGGHIFNIDGAGSQQYATPTFAPYGASKAALPQLMKSLVSELRGTAVGIHTASPGMMITELLMRGTRDKYTRRIFNILAEKPETTANWMVPRLRGIAWTGLNRARRTGKARLKYNGEEGGALSTPSFKRAPLFPGSMDNSPSKDKELPVSVQIARGLDTISGTYIQYLTPAYVIWRFLTAFRYTNRLIPESAAPDDDFMLDVAR